MRALVSCVALLFGIAMLNPSDAGAISKRKQCRDACGAKIDGCIAAGTKKQKCRRVTLKTCRKKGLQTCAVTTTTTTIRGASTTQVGATTTIAGGSTTTNPGGSTTTNPGGTTTTTLDDTPHNCVRSNATNLKAESSPSVSFQDYQYTPRCILIGAGQTITFNGNLTDFASHPLVGGTAEGAFKTPDPSSPIGYTNSGTSKAVLFASAGTFPFYCDVHGLFPAMTGVVFVDP
jgi:plastocyanin